MNKNGSGSKQATPERCETIKLAEGRLFVHGVASRLRTEALQFKLVQTWSCEFSLDAGDAQGLIHAWQRMVHEPSYEGGSYGSYGSYSSYASASAGYGEPVAYSSGASQEGYASYSTASRAYVTLVGVNPCGTLRLIHLSKIQSFGLALDAFELDSARVELRFQGGKSFDEIAHVNDGGKS